MSENTDIGKNLLQGELVVDQITLVNPEGAALDLKFIVQNLKLFESIDKYFVSGRCTIVDTQDIIKFFKIVGQESLTIQVRARDDSQQGDGHYSKKENQIDKVFRVYRISDEEPFNDGQQNLKSYVLHFIDHKYFLANQVRHNKVMYGSYSKILLQEWKELCFKNQEEPKNLTDYWDESYPYNRQLVCPDWTLSQLIDFCKIHANNYDDAFKNSFFFFGTVFGLHRFITFDSMTKLQIPVKFDAFPRTGEIDSTSANPDAPYIGINTQILSYTRPQRANLIEGMFNGAYASQQNVYDHDKKTMRVIRYNAKKDVYDKLHESNPKLHPLIRLGQPEVITKSDIMEEDGSVNVKVISTYEPDGDLAAETKKAFKTFSSNRFSPEYKSVNPFDEDGNLSNEGFQPPNYRDDSILKRMGLTAIMDQFIVKATIPFRPDITVGSMISLHLPDMHGGFPAKRLADDQYLVTKATFDINVIEAKGLIHLTCVKVSYSDDIVTYNPLSEYEPEEEI